MARTENNNDNDDNTSDIRTYHSMYMYTNTLSYIHMVQYVMCETHSDLWSIKSTTGSITASNIFSRHCKHMTTTNEHLIVINT